MRHTNALALMQDLFATYHTIFGLNGLELIIEENQKVSVKHVLPLIRTTKLSDRLEYDLSFSYHPLKREFRSLFKHNIKFAEAF